MKQDDQPENDVNLTSLHLLLTYQCNYECDHCFVWGSPSQEGVMTLAQIRDIYRQARELGTVNSIYLEGGEPFLYYPVMVRAAREAAEIGFRVGIVTNDYWATTVEDAVEWLRPLAGIVQDLSISTDLFHYDEVTSAHARNALAAAEQLGISVGTLTCEVPEGVAGYPTQIAGEPVESGDIMFKGRAAVKLVEGVARRPWREFDECPYETLDDPGRVHVDHLGNLHLCQGLTMGSLFERPLVEIVATYDPQAHPIVGPLLAGGPAALVERYDLTHKESYVDACHLCYEARVTLRERFPKVLGP
ncbi:MAG: radical SAM protein, partial [Chloroflexi bacterium]|nr:radical SAM protein [Chloroflexota bacterium]